jgi:hypothetical protein
MPTAGGMSGCDAAGVAGAWAGAGRFATVLRGEQRAADTENTDAPARAVRSAIGEACAAAREESDAGEYAKLKNDPKLVAAAWELRDRWLEQVNADPPALLSQGEV